MYKKYICVMKNVRMLDNFQKFIELIDDDKSEIHIFYHNNNDELIISEYIVQSNVIDNKINTSCCFISNNIKFINNTIREVNEIFDAFIYYNNEWDNEYQELIDFPNQLYEKLYFTKPNLIRKLTNPINDARIYIFNIDLLFNHLNNQNSFYNNQKFFILGQKLDLLNQVLQKEAENDKEGLKKHIIEKCLLSSDYGKVFFYSFILNNWSITEYINKIIKLAYDSRELSIENKWFIYSQMSSWLFVMPNYDNEDTSYYMYLLYTLIYDAFKNEMQELDYVLKDQRVKDRVLLVTGQFLSVQHAPTRVLLDHCYMLQKKMKNEVAVINSAELLSSVGFLPFSRIMIGNYLSDHVNVTNIEYDNININFRQYQKDMPNIKCLKEIINFIKETKPYYILSIGHTLTADLCSNIVPVITIATTPSKISITKGQFLLIKRELTPDDIKRLKRCGKDNDYVLTSAPVSVALKRKQISQFTRNELGIPSNKFIVTVVGNRLDYEIDDEFVQMLNKLYKYNIHIVFIGLFDDGYNKYCSKYHAFKSNTRYLGFQNDLLACYECCDLYVNPKRTGAAGTFTMAMCKGLPSITINYGDSSVFTVQDFIVYDYNEMEKEIIRYSIDTEYYNIQSEKSRKIVESYTNLETAFHDCLKTAMSRKMFK